MKSSVPRIDAFSNELIPAIRVKKTTALSRRVLHPIYIVSLVINDVFMTFLAFRVAYIVRFELNIPVFHLDVVPFFPYYSSLSLGIAFVWLAIFIAMGLYNRRNLLGGTDEYALVARATTFGFLTLILFGFLEPAFIIARGWLLLAWILSFFYVAFGRFLLRRVIYLMRRKGYFLSPTIIVGANEEGISLARQLLSWSTSGLYVVGFVDKILKPGTKLFGNLTILGGVEDLDMLINNYGVEELILASSAVSSQENMLEIFQQYGIRRDINFRMSSGLYEIITTGLNVKEFAYVPLVGVNKVRLTGWDIFLKFALDYGLTIPGLILISPFLGLFAILVKLDSPGPVFHRRRVMGVNGRQFEALKFRTMYVKGDEILDGYPQLKDELAKNFKLRNDPRVTRIGKWLRRFSFDELPQLINVLKRDMSLVGPRIISPEEMENYDQWAINLLTVKPGITGLWQVSGRSDVTYEERVRLDMHYIRNWSIWLDLQILWRTIPAVLMGVGAY